MLPFDLVQTGILDPGFSSLVFRLDGASGRRLFYDGMGANSRGNSALYGPGNEVVASANLINDFTTVLNRSGEYVLVLNGSSADPVPYSFKMVTPDDNNVAPTISDVPDQSTPVNVALPPIAFSVGDVETAPANLLVSARSSNPVLVPAANITFGGSGNSRTVSIVPATNQFGSALITLSVKDASGAEASRPIRARGGPGAAPNRSTAAESDGGNRRERHLFRGGGWHRPVCLPVAAKRS